MRQKPDSPSALVQRFEDLIIQRIAAGGSHVKGFATAKAELIRALGGRVSALSTARDDARSALGAFRFTLEYAVSNAGGKPVSMTFSVETANHLLDLLTPDDADADHDELWCALQRIAWNLCSCPAEPGGAEPPPVDPALHSPTCSYAAAHAPIAQEDTGPIEWGDDNFSLAVDPVHD